MIAPANPNDETSEETGGRGADTHLTPVQRNKIVGMMLNRKRRWRLTRAAKHEAMAATLNNLGDEDGRVRNAAVANLIRMEGQNQADQHKVIDKLQPDQQGEITNQQINIYLPSNGRETQSALTNDHNGNGKH